MGWWIHERRVRDDVADALGSDHPPEWHRERLTAFAVVAWRWVFFIVAVLVLGGLADLLGWVK